MITSNIDVLVQELEQIEKEVERKLKAMVSGFAGEVALKASENTPVASPEIIQRYEASYRQRERQYGVEMAPGYHAGAWKYVEGSITFDPNIYVEQQVEADALKDARSQYKLGDTFKIGAIGFAYQELEKGSSMQAPDGIIAPTRQAVIAAFSTNVKPFYDRG